MSTPSIAAVRPSARVPAGVEVPDSAPVTRAIEFAHAHSSPWLFDQRIPPSVMSGIVQAFPRLRMKHEFTDAACLLCASRPQTTYDNFARDFGVRSCPATRRRRWSMC